MDTQSKIENKQPILVVDDLSIAFSMYGKGFKKSFLRVSNTVSIDVHAGEILAVVGASGSGKSLLAHAIMGILPANATVKGRILYQGEELTEARRKQYRGSKIAFIPQSVDYLDPLMRVDKQVIGTNGTRAGQESAFSRYHLRQEVGKMYPHQLSGGMTRRVLFSTVTLGEADLIIADEPTPGLGADLSAMMLSHFREMADAGAGIVLITHDVDLAFAFADRIAVFYAGATVEIAPVAEFADGGDKLRHPYSKAFIDALPQNGFKPIPGTQPYAGNLPPGCPFAPRCAEKTSECLEKEVPMRILRGGKVRCIHAT